MRAVRIEFLGQAVVDRVLPDLEPGPAEVLVEVRAAGICHSDAHYRAGRSASLVPPITPGHEVAGVVRAVGRDVTTRRIGDRVCLHYLVTCGHCAACVAGREQWCTTGRMLGHHRDGGWAEAIVVPARNAVLLPDEIPFTHGAVLMCSSATALHALRRGRLAPGDTVAVVGVGGLGISAVQLARALGARDVFAIDPNPAKGEAAARFGAIPIAAGPDDDPVAAVREHTGGRGVDVSLELVGRPESMQTALRVAGVQGRAVIAGLSRTAMALDTYRDLLGPEVELIGANDHLLAELPLLLDLARRRRVDLTDVVEREVPLEARAINDVLDALERYTAPLRTVVTP